MQVSSTRSSVSLSSSSRSTSDARRAIGQIEVGLVPGFGEGAGNLLVGLSRTLTLFFCRRCTIFIETGRSWIPCFGNASLSVCFPLGPVFELPPIILYGSDQPSFALTIPVKPHNREMGGITIVNDKGARQPIGVPKDAPIAQDAWHIVNDARRAVFNDVSDPETPFAIASIRAAPDKIDISKVGARKSFRDFALPHFH